MEWLGDEPPYERPPRPKHRRRMRLTDRGLYVACGLFVASSWAIGWFATAEWWSR